MKAAPRPRVFIETYGCAFNISDSEVMAGLLEREGFELNHSAEGADAVIVNSCTVKDRSYLEFRKRIAALSRNQEGPAVILAGCVPKVYHQSREFAAHSQIGPDNLADIPEVVRRTLAGEIVQRTARAEQPRLNLPKRRRHEGVEIIPISKGCLGSCTFCQTVIARGRLHSFPEEEILAQLEAAVAEGIKIIWLTSQDCGAYGLDRGSNLPKLMRRIARMRGDFRVRVGMANPDLIKLYLPEFVEALADDRFFKFAHIPVQAGCDDVLSAMQRLYTAADFRRIVDALRERMPEITIATDVIVGFPTETTESFDRTVALMRETAPQVLNRSKFSPRPGTKAARLPLLPSCEVSRRSRELYQLHRTIAAEDGAQWSGWSGAAIVEEALRPGVFLARNFAYKPIVLEGQFAPGETVEIDGATPDGFHLNATVCSPQMA
ncbi:MAG: tRNA (N(6)-L-threonylcarbamoyladenosine(37)-C(2))-methylthiotransferase [Candidatus Sumerlaeaceae bacterium]|nr:tRNA (N(6)-L-threonylcarbamoyladenosine(37)-C(2))-methylthiotransferase [Candidatus Sumerlaeaceae bacterium]